MKYDMTIEEIRDGYRDLYFKSSNHWFGFYLISLSYKHLASDVYNAEEVVTHEDEEGLSI